MNEREFFYDIEVASLPSEKQQVVYLLRRKGYSLRDIAVALDIIDNPNWKQSVSSAYRTAVANLLKQQDRRLAGVPNLTKFERRINETKK